MAVALLSTAAVLILVGWVVLHSKNWAVVRESFFNGREFRDSFPDIAQKFVRNIEYFLICEAVILTLALLLAVLRSLPGPVFFPVRVLTIAYVDLFRGLNSAGQTIVLVTHDPRLAERYADRIVTLVDGALAKDAAERQAARLEAARLEAIR